MIPRMLTAIQDMELLGNFISSFKQLTNKLAPETYHSIDTEHWVRPHTPTHTDNIK